MSLSNDEVLIRSSPIMLKMHQNERKLWSSSSFSSSSWHMNRLLETTIQCLESKVSRLGSLLFQALLKIFYLSLTKKTMTPLQKKLRPSLTPTLWPRSLSNYLSCRAFIIQRFQTCTELLISILIRE